MTTQTTDLSTLVIDREFLDRSYNLGTRKCKVNYVTC